MTNKKKRVTRNAIRSELDGLRDEAGATPPPFESLRIAHAAVDLPPVERIAPDVDTEGEAVAEPGDPRDGVGITVYMEYNPEIREWEAVDQDDYLFPDVDGDGDRHDRDATPEDTPDE